MSHAFVNQPLKGLYLVYQIISLFIRVPLWILLGLPRSLRPRKSWSLGRVLVVNFLRYLTAVSDQTGPLIKFPDHTAITPGKGVNGVWIDSADHLVAGDLEKWAKVAGVKGVRLPGYWFHKKSSSIKVAEKARPGERVFLNLHGSAYIRLSAHPSDMTAEIPRQLVEFVDSVNRAFSLEYRLSSAKPFKVANPFPAALIDAVAAYNYLVDTLSFEPSNIIVVGDSAGGNLAHALVRYLVENQNSPDVKLPAPPSGLILIAPWSDLSLRYEDLRHGSDTIFHSGDIIGPRDTELDYATDAFAGPHGYAIKVNRYVSPASLHPDLVVDFKGFPRTFLAVGDADLIIDQVRILKQRMVRDLGEGDGVKEGEGKLRYHEAPDAIHDHICFPWFEPQRTDTLKEIAEWVALSP